MFDRLGSLIARRWGWVLIGWASLAVLVLMAAPSWEDVARDGDFAYLPDRMSSVRGEKLLEAAFPDERSKSSVFLVLARRDGPLRPEDYAMGDRLAAQFTSETEKGIVNVVSYRTEVVGEKLRSPAGPEGQAALVVLDLQNEFAAVGNMDLIERIQGAMETLRHDPAFPVGLQLGMTGSAAIGSDMLLAAEESIRNTEQTTVILVVLILLLVYRAPGTGACSVGDDLRFAGGGDRTGRAVVAMERPDRMDRLQDLQHDQDFHRGDSLWDGHRFLPCS